MNHRGIVFKALCLVLIVTFMFNQVAFAADTFSYQYKYSASKQLLQGNLDKDAHSYMAPAYLLNAQAQHEAIINQKNMVETESVYRIENQKPQADESIILQKKQSSSGGSGGSRKQIAYTLADYDANGSAQEIFVYTYSGPGGSLSKVVSYDIRDLGSIPWIGANLEKISAEGEDLVMGSFAPGDYTLLTDNLKISTVSYFGSSGKEKVDYILSGYVDGSPGEVSLYSYDPGTTALTEVNTYEITALNINFDNTSGEEWKAGVRKDATLTKKAIYEGAAASEQLVYVLSEYDSSGAAGRIDCYDYSGSDSPITQVRAYNLKGLDLSSNLADLRAGLSSSDQYLISKTNYKGKKDHEKVDNVLSSYYLNTNDNTYKPSRESDYVYDDTGRLERTDTYNIKNGARALRWSSEFTGLKGHEVISRSSEYDIDGVTVISVSIYEYQNRILGKVTKYLGADVKSVTFYEGREGKELVNYTVEYDIVSGAEVSRTDYTYDLGALRLTETRRGGALVASVTYTGLKGSEKASASTTFDLSGELLSTSAYQYNSNGSLETISTFNPDGKKISQTRYVGVEGQERIGTATGFDLVGNALTVSYYVYGPADNIENMTTYDSNGSKISLTIYQGSQNYERVSSVTAYDLDGNTLTKTIYNYNAGFALISTITTDSSGVIISESGYSGPANYEKVAAVTGFDRLHGALTITDYLYNAAGALAKAITTDGSGVELSESAYTGLSGYEKVSSATSFDKLHNALTITNYTYGSSGALLSTITTDALGLILSGSAYSGSSGQEKVSGATSFDKLHNTLTITNYLYDNSGALVSTVTKDSSGIILSESAYSGLSNQEKVTSATSFDKLHNALTTTSYLYNNAGALASTVTKDAGGTILSESAYSGLSNAEKVTSATSFDKLRNLLTQTNYIYDASGALTSTVTADADGTILSKSAYSGLSNLEKVTSAVSFDKLHNALIVTSYIYDVSGALASTITKDATGLILSESVYAGPLGAEKVTSAASFDKLHNALAITSYLYDASGALTSTVTKDASGIILSESAYSGLTGQEKVASATSFDKLHNIISTTNYTYDASGALAQAITKDSSGIILSESIYAGPMNQEKVVSATSFDRLYNALTTTSYLYNSAGALVSTVTKDAIGVILSESAYSGPASQEKILSASSFDRLYNRLSTTNYTYDASGALASTVTKDASGAILSESVYAGPLGAEKVTSAASFDKLHNALAITSYLYDASGALTSTVTKDASGVTLSGSAYSGLSNREKVTSSTSFDKLHNTLTTTAYIYDASGALASTITKDATGLILSESIYTGLSGQEKITSATSFDKLHNALTITSYLYNTSGALISTVTKDAGGTILSESAYTGSISQEKVVSAISFDKIHNALMTTSYVYDASGALTSTITKDALGVILSESIYSGLSNQEKVTSAVSFDKLHNTLTTIAYIYDNSGALTSTVTRDASGATLSESIYAGLSGQEKALRAVSFDKLHNILTNTAYLYDNAGALASTVTKDAAGVILSESAYSGLSGWEKVITATSFDKLHNVLSTTNYTYDSFGALFSTVTKDSRGFILSESAYTGSMNQEKVTSAASFDKLHNALTTTNYLYDASGALTDTITVDADDVILSQAYYSGLQGQEKVSSVMSFDKLHNVLTTTGYIYDNAGALISTTTSDASGVILSESAYSGPSGQEKVASVTSFDRLHNALTVTNYLYNNIGALISTVTTDASETILSESTYSGFMNQERVASAASFDKLHNLLTTTNYLYDASGALFSTVTKDAAGIILSESAYTGSMNQEKVTSATSFDKLRNVLTTTGYLYNNTGALTSTVTKGADGVILSESTYAGSMGAEKVISATSFDKLYNALTTTNYLYDASGALVNTMTTDASGMILSESAYSGLVGQEKIASALSFDKLANQLTTTSYVYDASGALINTVTVDTDGVILSESAYDGLQGQEKVQSTLSFDKLHNLLTETSYIYNNAGALAAAITKDSLGVALSESTYTGLSGQERIASAASFDRLHNALTTTSYGYNASGALARTVTKDSSGLVISEAAYAGPVGQEKIQSAVNSEVDTQGHAYLANRVAYIYNASGALSSTVTKNPDDGVISLAAYKGLTGQERVDTATGYEDSTVKSITHYQYGADGALSETLTYKADGVTKVSETYFVGRSGFELSDFSIQFNNDGTVKGSSFYFYGPAFTRAKDAFREDALSIVKSYKTANLAGDETSLEIESISYYQGKKGYEVINFAQSYGINNDTGLRELQATTIYEYDTRRTLKKANTYFGGVAGSSDTSVLVQNFVAEYTGERGAERISLMRGTTCQYPMPDAASWNYYVRTDFTYDTEGRNTGYAEKTYSSDNSLAGSASVEFSGFDSKDRYGKMVRAAIDSGEVTTETGYVYDSGDHLISYKSTGAKPGEETKYREVSLEGYANGKAHVITTWTLDSTGSRTGDYSRQSDIVYGQYGRISSYTITSSTDSNVTTSNVFDIVYDKDKTIEDKIASSNEVITFGPNYSVRNYKYNSKGENETIVITNGDYISVYNKDNVNIYFEYTPAMENLKGQSNTNNDPGEGAGPRPGSQAPASPFTDILQQALFDSDYQTINLNGQTQITYTTDGEVAQITDTKGNVFIYSDNKPTELLDSNGNEIALISYLKDTDSGLTVSMTFISGEQSVFVYDKDNRRVSVSVIDPLNVTTRFETYTYTKDAENKNVLSAIVHKEFYDNTNLVVVDTTETYDLKGKPTEILTNYHNGDIRNYTFIWTAAYDTNENTVSSTEMRCEAAQSSIFNGTAGLSGDISGYMTIFTAGRYDSLSKEDKYIFGVNDTSIFNSKWSAEYDTKNRLIESSSAQDVFKYEKVTDALDAAYGGKLEAGSEIVRDDDLSTYMIGHANNETGNYGSITSYISFDPTHIDHVKWMVGGYADSGNGPSWMSGTVSLLVDGKWIMVYSESSNWAISVSYVPQDRDNGGVGWDNVTAMRIDMSGYGSDCGSAAFFIFDMQAIPDDKYYIPIQSDHKTSNVSIESYDDKNNVTKYIQTDTERLWGKDWNSSISDAGTLTTTTTWTSSGYLADKATGFTQIVHKTSDHGLDLTETTTRSACVYENGLLVSYDELFKTTAASNKTTEQSVTGITYDNGRISGLTSITNEYSSDGVTLNNQTKLIRSDMIYDLHGNLSSWKDSVSNPKVSDDVTVSVTSNTNYDILGRLLSFTTTKEGLQEISSGVKEWRKTVTERQATYYNTIDQTCYTRSVSTVYGASGNVIIAPTTIIQRSLTYDNFGREYGYLNLTNDGRSWVDSSTYNSIGQLTGTYTQLDPYSYTAATYHYDASGDISSSESYYHYYRVETVTIIQKGLFGDDTYDVTYNQAYDETKTYDRFGAVTNDVKTESSTSTVDAAHLNAWNQIWSYIKPVIDIFLHTLDAVFFGVGTVLAIIFDTVVSMIDGTFSWTNLGIQIGVALLQLSGTFDKIFESIKAMLPASFQNLLGTMTDASKATGVWNTNIYMSAVFKGLIQYTASRGITEIGNASGWNRSLTSAVSSFASMAIGYGYDNAIGKISLANNGGVYMTRAAMESIAIASIDYYVSQHPSELNSALSAVAKEAIGAYSNRLEAQALKESFSNNKAYNSYNYQLTKTEKLFNDARQENNSTSQTFDYNRHETVKELFTDSYDTRTFDVQTYSNFYQLASDHNSILQEVYNQIQPVSRAASEYGSASVLDQAAMMGNGGEFNNRFTSSGFSYMGEMDSSFLTGKALEVAQGLKVTAVDVLYNAKDGEAYIMLDISNGIKNNIETVLNIQASDAAIKSYNENFSLQEGDHARVIMTGDGSKAYLQGEAGFDSLKGSAKEWALRAGLTSGKVSFEVNLKTGDIYIPLNVKDVNAFFGQEGFANNASISKLSRIAINSLGSINNIKILDLVVKITPDNTSEIVGATITVNSISDIKSDSLKNAVSKFIGNLNLRENQFDIVLFIDPQADKVNVEALSLKLDNIKEIVNELNNRDPQQQKLGCELQTLLQLVNNNPKNLDRVYLTVDNNGEYKINVRMLSSIILSLSGLMNKLGFGEATGDHSRLFNTTKIDFIINGATGVYSLDLGLKCQRYEPLILRTGSVDTEKDSLGRVISEDIYDKTGNLVTAKQYNYFADGSSAITQAFFAEASDGTFKTLKLITMFDSLGNTASARFDGLTADFAGSTFKYIIGTSVLEFSVIAAPTVIPAKAGIQSIILTGDIPAAALELKLNLGDGLSYEPYSIPVELKPDGLFTLGKDMININGFNQTGFTVIARSEATKQSLFLYNGARIAINDSAISIISARAFFGDINGVPAPVIASPEGTKRLQGVQLTPAETPVQNSSFGVSLAWADTMGAVKSFTVTDNIYSLAKDGSVLPVSGVFDIKDDKVIAGAMDKYLTKEGEFKYLSNSNFVGKTAEVVGAIEKVTSVTADKEIKSLAEEYDSNIRNFNGYSFGLKLAYTLNFAVRQDYILADAFSLGFTKGFVTGSGQTITGLVDLTALARSAIGELIANPEAFRAKYNISREAWQLVNKTIENIFADGFSVWYAEGAVLKSAELGRAIGEWVGSAVVMGKVIKVAGAAAKGVSKTAGASLSKLTERIVDNGTIQKSLKPMGELLERGEQASSRIWSKTSEGICRAIDEGRSSFIGSALEKGWDSIGTIKEYFGNISGEFEKGFRAGREVYLEARDVFERMGQSFEEGNPVSDVRVSKGQLGFKGRIEAVKSVSEVEAKASGAERAASGAERAASGAERAASGAERAASGAESKTINRIDRVIQFVERVIGTIAKESPGEVRDKYITGQGSAAIERAASRTGSLSSFTGGLNQAWKAIGSGSGLRQGWLAYGLTGGALANLAAYTIALPIGESFATATISGIKDVSSFVYDFTASNNPASLGAAFREELRSSVDYAYQFWAEKEVAAEGWATDKLTATKDEYRHYTGSAEPKVYIERDIKTGVASIATDLDWGNPKRPGWLAFDIISFLTPLPDYPNIRWAHSVRRESEAVIGEFNSGMRYIFSTGINNKGLGIEKANVMYSTYQTNEKIIEGHSAATEGDLYTMFATDAKYYTFDSPRVMRDTLVKCAVESGKSPDQLLVITAKGDLPHWPSFSDLKNTVSSNIFTDWNLGMTLGKTVATAISGSFDDYSNNQGMYTYVYLDRDLTHEANRSVYPNLLSHGGMIDGIFANHIYNAWVITPDGKREYRKEVTIGSLRRDFIRRGESQ